MTTITITRPTVPAKDWEIGCACDADELESARARYLRQYLVVINGEVRQR